MKHHPSFNARADCSRSIAGDIMPPDSAACHDEVNGNRASSEAKKIWKRRRQSKGSQTDILAGRNSCVFDLPGLTAISTRRHLRVDVVWGTSHRSSRHASGNSQPLISVCFSLFQRTPHPCGSPLISACLVALPCLDSKRQRRLQTKTDHKMQIPFPSVAIRSGALQAGRFVSRGAPGNSRQRRRRTIARTRRSET